MNKNSDISERPPRANKETDQSFLLEAAILPSHEEFEFVGELAQDIQEMPFVEPTNSLLEKMFANSIDSLPFFQSPTFLGCK
jgi:hypothetical protein